LEKRKQKTKGGGHKTHNSQLSYITFWLLLCFKRRIYIS